VSYADRLLATHPRPSAADAGVLVACIEACEDCAQACTGCADACLGEDGVAGLVSCVRRCLDCADVCAATGRVVTRRTEEDASVTRALVEACAIACAACGAECEEHARHGMEHCRVCAEACRRCERACRVLLGALT
jgi:Domain of Unknown Function (DUF326)